jgi:hypothetical protein
MQVFLTAIGAHKDALLALAALLSATAAFSAIFWNQRQVRRQLRATILSAQQQKRSGEMQATMSEFITVCVMLGKPVLQLPPEARRDLVRDFVRHDSSMRLMLRPDRAEDLFLLGLVAQMLERSQQWRESTDPKESALDQLIGKIVVACHRCLERDRAELNRAL